MKEFKVNLPFLCPILIFAILLLIPQTGFSQDKTTKKKSKSGSTQVEEEKSAFDTVSLPGLKFRSIGPALTSGRISEVAVDPNNHSRYFVAASAGGVWRTLNAGLTFDPVFDGQGTSSIGTVVIDPGNPSTIWVGSGENNNQRSVAYGDGVYKSLDGGTTWKNMGLKTSEHIGMIIVHPDNSDIIYVAAIGPLWAAGGDRGLYRSNDGGESWTCVLSVDAHTGVNDVVMDPRNPDVLYASSFQRRRHVFTYLGGGPGSTIYKSTDGGDTWNKSAQGLPSVDIGRIGLAISPVDPEIIYAMVEAAEGKGGFFRSTNRGASWEKQSSYASSGNYYVELVPDPVDANKVYSMDTWMQVSGDGGKTWSNVGEDYKHIDNHSLWIDPEDPNHLIAGCDGGVYESWDLARTWDFKANLPVTQFYKVSLDNDEPFYNVFGGTQDNFSLGGPSRTNSGNGISNEQWFITHGGDGFETQVDPNDPNIIYAQSQYGFLVRYDKQSGEELGIKPHERLDEPAYRWNWDAPLVISSHVPGRIYFAANKVFVSEDRGNNWNVISEDVTRQINRNELKVMGRVWSMDAVAKNGSTTQYGNIVALAESPVNPDLLFAGTDDGLIQISDNRGQSWRKVDGIPGAPDTSYVNMIIASSHDENVVYACFNHHKYGDFKPYVFVSRDKGNTWTSIVTGLPEKGSVYALAEDHVDPNLLFAGTEFSCFVSNNAGQSWRKLANGLPTVPVRDIAIQQRENDLVLATFGRGFYVLDDYSALRHLNDESLAQDGLILPVRDAWSFENKYPLGLPGKSFQGDNYYLGENLGSVAILTYYVKDKFESAKDMRIKKEHEEAKEGKDNVYPTYDALVAERNEEAASLYITIRNSTGEIVRKLSASAASNGVQRIAWDLRSAAKDPVRTSPPAFYNPFGGISEGPKVAPGLYTATLSRWQDGKMMDLGAPVSFQIYDLDHHTIPNPDQEATVAFKLKVEEVQRVQQTLSRALSSASGELGLVRKAVTQMDQPQEAWLERVVYFENKIRDMNLALNGDGLYASLDIDVPPSVSQRIGLVAYESKYSSAAPTGTHMMSLNIAQQQLVKLVDEANVVLGDELDAFRKELQDAGAPYIPNLLPAFKTK